MPLYEYECTACLKHTEKIQKFSDPEITTCPFCGGELKRVISAPAFALKGGGWYADGYGSAKPAASSGAEGSADSGSKSGAGSGSGDNAAPAASASASTPAAPAASAPAPAASSDKK
jgi:putative FmdB family regulatory protein